MENYKTYIKQIRFLLITGMLFSLWGVKAQNYDDKVGHANDNKLNTININTKSGFEFRDFKRSTAIFIPTGDNFTLVSLKDKSVCTAVLVNTVNQVKRYYMMTSAHCLENVGKKFRDKGEAFLSFDYEMTAGPFDKNLDTYLDKNDPNYNNDKKELDNLKKDITRVYKVDYEVLVMQPGSKNVLIEVHPSSIDDADMFHNTYAVGWNNELFNQKALDDIGRDQNIFDIQNRYSKFNPFYNISFPSGDHKKIYFNPDFEDFPLVALNNYNKKLNNTKILNLMSSNDDKKLKIGEFAYVNRIYSSKNSYPFRYYKWNQLSDVETTKASFGTIGWVDGVNVFKNHLSGALGSGFFHHDRLKAIQQSEESFAHISNTFYPELKRGNSYKSTIETNYLQKYLDPQRTFLNDVPSANFYSSKEYYRPPNNLEINCNLEILPNDSFETPGISESDNKILSENVIFLPGDVLFMNLPFTKSKKINFNNAIWSYLRGINVDQRYHTNLNTLNLELNIYLLLKNSSDEYEKILYRRYSINNQQNLTTVEEGNQVQEINKLNGFYGIEYINKDISFSNKVLDFLKNYSESTGKIEMVSEMGGSKIEITEQIFENNIPIVVELKNNGNITAHVKSISYPGDVPKNALQFYSNFYKLTKAQTHINNTFKGNYKYPKAKLNSDIFISSIQLGQSQLYRGSEERYDKKIITDNNGGYVNLDNFSNAIGPIIVPTLVASTLVDQNLNTANDLKLSIEVGGLSLEATPISVKVWIDFFNDELVDGVDLDKNEFVFGKKGIAGHSGWPHEKEHVAFKQSYLSAEANIINIPFKIPNVVTLGMSRPGVKKLARMRIVVMNTETFEEVVPTVFKEDIRGEVEDYLIVLKAPSETESNSVENNLSFNFISSPGLKKTVVALVEQVIEESSAASSVDNAPASSVDNTQQSNLLASFNSFMSILNDSKTKVKQNFYKRLTNNQLTDQSTVDETEGLFINNIPEDRLLRNNLDLIKFTTNPNIVKVGDNAIIFDGNHIITIGNSEDSDPEGDLMYKAYSQHTTMYNIIPDIYCDNNDNNEVCTVQSNVLNPNEYEVLYEEGGITNGLSVRFNNTNIQFGVKIEGSPLQKIDYVLPNGMEPGVYKVILISFDYGIMKLYVDGQKVGENTYFADNNITELPDHFNQAGLGGFVSNGNIIAQGSIWDNDTTSTNTYFHGIIDYFGYNLGILDDATISDLSNNVIDPLNTSSACDSTTPEDYTMYADDVLSYCGTGNYKEQKEALAQIYKETEEGSLTFEVGTAYNIPYATAWGSHYSFLGRKRSLKYWPLVPGSSITAEISNLREMLLPRAEESKALTNPDKFKHAPLYMDVFYPKVKDDISETQLSSGIPVIIWLFGGGFIKNDNSEIDLKICRWLASKGYIVAAIDYRLGMNLSDGELAKRAPMRAWQDIKAAIQYWKYVDADNSTPNGIYSNAGHKWKVNPNKVYGLGWSAGGITVLNNLYLDDNTFVSEQQPNLDGSDGYLAAIAEDYAFSVHDYFWPEIIIPSIISMYNPSAEGSDIPSTFTPNGLAKHLIDVSGLDDVFKTPLKNLIDGVALSNLYNSLTSTTDFYTYALDNYPTVPCIDINVCNGTSPTQDVNTIKSFRDQINADYPNTSQFDKGIAMAGAIPKLEWMNNEQNKPIASIHHVDDVIINVDEGIPFDDLYNLSSLKNYYNTYLERDTNKPLSTLHGGLGMSLYAESNNLDNYHFLELNDDLQAGNSNKHNVWEGFGEMSSKEIEPKIMYYLDAFFMQEDYQNVSNHSKLTNAITDSNLKINYTTPNFDIFPNPAHDEINIIVEVRQEGPLLIEIYDMIGQRVYDMNKDKIEAGHQYINIRDFNLSTGTYILKILAGDFMGNKQIIIK